MKLYIWTGLHGHLFNDWQAGYAYAIAESEEQAKILIWQKMLANQYLRPEQYPYAVFLANTGEDLSHPPAYIHDLATGPFADYIMGSA